MPLVQHVIQYDPPKSFRSDQVRGMFDYQDPAVHRKWSVEVPDVSEPWSIGLITGPSGSGKSQIAGAAFGAAHQRQSWTDRPLVEDFPPEMSVKDITELLTRVGLGSVPAWLLPHRALSVGQQFRADMAHALATANPSLPLVIDEFTSTVDREVAKTVSVCVAKIARKRKLRLVCVACHYDIADWLDPDWLLDMADGTLARRSVRSRPPMQLAIHQCDTRLWRLFAHHHYLTHELSPRARCFVGAINGRPVAFLALIHYPHQKYGLVDRVHRVVVLPDYMGLGLAHAIMDAVLSTCRRRVYLATSHGPFARSLSRSPRWETVRRASFCAPLSASASASAVRSGVQTSSFRYVGPKQPELAADAHGGSR